MQAISQGSGSRLVDEFFDLQPGELAGHARGLALCIAEVSRHADDGLVHRHTQGTLGVSLEAAQQHGREFFSAVGVPVKYGLTGAAHVALEQCSGKLRVGVEAFSGDVPDDELAVVVEADHTGRQQVAQRIGQDARLLALPHRDEAVGGAQVDTNDHSHFSLNDAANLRRGVSQIRG